MPVGTLVRYAGVCERKAARVTVDVVLFRKIMHTTGGGRGNSRAVLNADSEGT